MPRRLSSSVRALRFVAWDVSSALHFRSEFDPTASHAEQAPDLEQLLPLFGPGGGSDAAGVNRDVRRRGVGAVTIIFLCATLIALTFVDPGGVFAPPHGHAHVEDAGGHVIAVSAGVGKDPREGFGNIDDTKYVAKERPTFAVAGSTTHNEEPKPDTDSPELLVMLNTSGEARGKIDAKESPKVTMTDDEDLETDSEFGEALLALSSGGKASGDECKLFPAGGTLPHRIVYHFGSVPCVPNVFPVRWLSARLAAGHQAIYPGTACLPKPDCDLAQRRAYFVPLLLWAVSVTALLVQGIFSCASLCRSCLPGARSNDAGCTVVKSEETGLWYCHRIVGQELPGYGQCGPHRGPQCASCARYQVADRWVVDGVQPTVASIALVVVYTTIVCVCYAELSHSSGLPWEGWMAFVLTNSVDLVVQASVRSITVPLHLADWKALVGDRVVFLHSPIFSTRIDTLKDIIFVALSYKAGYIFIMAASFCVLLVSQMRSWFAKHLRGEIRFDHFVILRPHIHAEAPTEVDPHDGCIVDVVLYLARVGKAASTPLKQEFAVWEDVPQAFLQLAYFLMAGNPSGFILASVVVACGKTLTVFFLTVFLADYGEPADHVANLQASVFISVRVSAVQALKRLGGNPGPVVANGLVDTFTAEFEAEPEARCGRCLDLCIDKGGHEDLRDCLVDAVAQLNEVPVHIPGHLAEVVAGNRDYQLRITAARALVKLRAPQALPTIVEALEDHDERIRLAAAEFLGSFNDRVATVALLKALEADADGDVRSTVATSLGRIKDPEVVPDLAKMLDGHKDGSVRRLVAALLGSFEDPRATVALLKALGADADGDVRSTVAASLGRINDPMVVRDLTKMLDGHKNGSVRRLVATLLGTIKDPKAVPALTKALQADKNRDVRLAVATSLVDIDGPQAVLALMQVLDRDVDAQVRLTALSFMSDFKDPRAVPACMKALGKDAEVDIRIAAARFLAVMKGPDAVPAFSKALEGDADARVRLEAAEFLWGMRDPRAVPACINALGKDANVDIREGAAKFLGDMKARDGVPACIEALERDADARVRLEAAKSLWGMQDPRAVPVAMKALGNHESSDIRRAAAEFLVKMHDARALQVLINALGKDTDSEVRRVAKLFLVDYKDPGAVKDCINVLTTDPDAMAQLVAANFLWLIKDERAVPACIRALGKGADSDVRDAMTKFMGDIKGDADAVNDCIRALKEDTDAMARLGAARFLGRKKDSGAGVACINALTHDENARVREAAANSLRQMQARDKRASEALITQLKEDGDVQVRIAIAGALGDMSGDWAIEPLLMTLMHDKAIEVQLAAAQALANLGTAGNDIIKGKVRQALKGLVAIITRLEQDGNVQIRIAIAGLLGDIECSWAIEPLLTTLKNDKVVEVQLAAAQALAKVGTAGNEDIQGKVKRSLHRLADYHTDARIKLAVQSAMDRVQSAMDRVG